MGVPHFPVPADVQEMLMLLNASRAWNLSLAERGGALDLLDGDQLQFSARTPQEVEAFLAGCFLATYQGKSLKQIKREIADGRGAHLLTTGD